MEETVPINKKLKGNDIEMVIMLEILKTSKHVEDLHIKWEGEECGNGRYSVHMLKDYKPF